MPDTYSDLIREAIAFRKAEGLPHFSLQKLHRDHLDMLTEPQIGWIAEWIERWDALREAA
jgi:hypothetical protein